MRLIWIISGMFLFGACASRPTSKDGGKPPAVPPTVLAVARGGEVRSDFRMRPFQEVTLSNGLKILYMEDNSLPYVSFSMLVRAGSVHDPENLPGVSNFVAELLDKGAGDRNSIQIAERFAQLGASFDASSGMEFTRVEASSLAWTAKDTMELFHSIVTQPTFTDDEVARLNKLAVAQLERQSDNAESFSSRAFVQYLMPEHPYGRPGNGTLASLKQISKKHIISYYIQLYRPGNSSLSVVGQLTPALKEQIERAFGGWQAREQRPFVLPEPAQVQGVKVLLVDKPDLVQAQIRMGRIGIRRLNEDYLTVRLANTIVGGGWNSRLFHRIRKQLGLTYTISSGFDARLMPGPFTISTFTKNQTVGQAIQEILGQLRDLRDKGVTAHEVDSAKGYLQGTFPQLIDTAEGQAAQLSLLRFYGVPDSYLTSFLTNVERLGVSDVNRVLRKYLDERAMRIVVYGKASEIRDQLKDFNVEVKSANQIQ